MAAMEPLSGVTESMYGLPSLFHWMPPDGDNVDLGAVRLSREVR
ncbi:hypothetical protein [Kutzneria kofuensis]|uniref:Uncharacterized protein n=1 Tax=Kutzneria kofuensis TaxID=103725 RepID=A0A7W9KQ88_9PSEU|nr:hypothetical protein [Kutzneria kofuensis]MBB5896635.1 hypothetical protein [Kutzneria kofuensis]